MTGTGIMLVAVAMAATGDTPLSAAPNPSPSHVIVDSGSITVNNASAIPVTGSVSVSGTVDLGAAAQVGINNTAANPIPVRNLDEPGRHGFQSACTGGTWYPSFLAFATPCAALPAGKPAVIEQFSIRIFVPQGVRPMASLQQDVSGRTFYLPLTFEGSGWGTSTNPWDVYIGAAHTKIYVDAGETLRVRLDRPSAASEGRVDDAVISGYTVDP